MGEKRKEFPDAISIEALAQRFNEADGIFVISGDEDVRGACAGQKGLFPLQIIEEFLQAELADHQDVSWISHALKEQEDEVRSAISTSFRDGYIYLDDADGEVGQVEVEENIIKEIKLISALEEEAEIAVACKIRFLAEISYDNPSMTVYDEGEKFSFGTVEKQVERTVRDTFSLTLQLDRVRKVITDFYSSDGGSRSISTYDDDQT